MKLHLLPILAACVACHRSEAAAPELTVAPVLAQAVPEIDALVRGLADENFRNREKATRELWELGEKALPALKEAAASSDPEQAVRAQDLLRKIQLHITPDTDPSVISLVERYGSATPGEKAALLGKMRGKRAWRQILKLYAAETDAEFREKLRPSMNVVAVRAARQRLLQNDAAGAREFLEMAPADAAGLLALAEFHRSHGTLEAELELANTHKGRKAAAWRLALHRAAGNPAAAREAAIAAGEPRIAAAMAALVGDPLPWLREIQQQPKDFPLAAHYASIAAKRWLAQKGRPADLEPLMRALTSRNSAERDSAMSALFLLGEADAAETALVKSQPLDAFLYFEALERIPEALQALGLDPKKPDYKPWVEKRIATLLDDDIENQHEASSDEAEILNLARFLERRGLHEQASAVFSGPLAAMAEKDLNAFVDFLGKLFAIIPETTDHVRYAPRLARNIGVSWAGEDQGRWEDLVVAACGDDDRTGDWWDWLKEIKPDSDRVERFDAMLALFGIGPDPRGLRTRWLGLLWKSAEAAAPSERTIMAARIADLADETGDVATCLKAWEQMSPEGREEIFWGKQIIHFSAVERWDDAAKVILKQISAITEAQQQPEADQHAYAAAALREAGDKEQAATHERWADRLNLGNATVAIKIGNGHAYGRDYPRAAEWYARAAIQADPDSDEFVLAMKLHAEALQGQEKWLENAAISEVVAACYSLSTYPAGNQLPFMRQRMQADMARALSRLKSDRSGAIATLAKCHRTFISDGSLADVFFPALRKAGLQQEHDTWFKESWDRISKIISRYPDSDNTLNTAAWFAARALRQLDAAEKHLRKAIAANPEQAAYLDTMGEIQFARGNRAKALEWSVKAVNFAPADSMLRRQQQRFRAEPFPK
ncbi:MAG: hypothetical protein Q8Q59_15285 [Luteolibacter sp.]|nr:hypothetical protein [Luteolibacter sp.]